MSHERFEEVHIFDEQENFKNFPVSVEDDGHTALHIFLVLKGLQHVPPGLKAALIGDGIERDVLEGSIHSSESDTVFIKRWQRRVPLRFAGRVDGDHGVCHVWVDEPVLVLEYQ